MFGALDHYFLLDNTNVWFRKISIPTPRKVIGNSEGEGGVSKANIFKGKYEAKLGGIKAKNLLWEELWIFSGTTQSEICQVPPCSTGIREGTCSPNG